MKIIDRLVKPLVQMACWQNFRFRHTLKEMSKYNQNTGNHLNIIDPGLSWIHNHPLLTTPILMPTLTLHLLRNIGIHDLFARLILQLLFRGIAEAIIDCGAQVTG